MVPEARRFGAGGQSAFCSLNAGEPAWIALMSIACTDAPYFSARRTTNSAPAGATLTQ